MTAAVVDADGEEVGPMVGGLLVLDAVVVMGRDRLDGEEKVVLAVVVGVTLDCAVAFVRALWARNAARKLAKKGRLVGMLSNCFDWGLAKRDGPEE